MFVLGGSGNDRANAIADSDADGFSAWPEVW
jgi:hypothetical protein